MKRIGNNEQSKQSDRSKRLPTSVRAGEVGATAEAIRIHWKERGYSSDSVGDCMVANAMYNGTY